VAAVERLERTSASLGLPVFGPGDPRTGLVNVVAAEQGMVLPGDLLVGADAHVATNGAFGALALVISDDEVVDVVRTGEVWRVRPATVRTAVAGKLTAGASAKDVALWLLGRLGPGMADGKVLELVGPVVAGLGVEGRMTLTNVAVESGAVAVVIAPDVAVERYLAGRPFAPRGAAWTRAVAGWRHLASDQGAGYDADVVAFGGLISPQVTWGTHADQVVALDGVVPFPELSDRLGRARHEQALVHQDLSPGAPVSEIEIDQVFVGSCANARLDDLRAAADVVRGGRVQVPSWVVPGSWPVRRQAEAEGLHRVFIDAGFEWREPGCSLCLGANGDAVRPGSRLASTANRPVRGLVGPSAKVHLLSPASAAASALSGRLTAHRRTS
jgi:3-isopropylmalate/(R)-2-methylmalate dehydratase large subunit